MQKLRRIKFLSALSTVFLVHASAVSLDLDASYSAKVAALVRSNTMLDTSNKIIENDPVIFEVNLNKKGFIKSLKKTKSSKVVGFDDAISDAIERSQPYPKDSNGIIPRMFVLQHYPMDPK